LLIPISSFTILSYLDFGHIFYAITCGGLVLDVEPNAIYGEDVVTPYSDITLDGAL